MATVICYFSAEEVIEFCRSVGDHNPVHHSNHAALQLGLKGCIVPGLLVTERVEQMAINELGELSSLAVRFFAPIYVGNKIICDILKRPVHRATSPIRIIISNEDQEIAALADVTARAKLSHPVRTV